LTGTSANISEKPPSTKIKEVIAQFKKYQPDLVISAGNLPKSKPSTVLDLTTFPPKILRA
jgi:L-threonylcarbamoyladenylate synthase